MSGFGVVVEVTAFDSGDSFSVFLNAAQEPQFCEGHDLRIFVSASLPREKAAEMLEHAARRIRDDATTITLDLADARRLLQRIGGGVIERVRPAGESA